MYDRELALEILNQIYKSSQTILKRFEPIKSFDLNAEAVYDVCSNHVQLLGTAIKTIINEI